MQENPRRIKTAACLFSAAILSACGGGGGDDPPKQADSEACFNKGLYTAGSAIEYTSVDGNGKTWDNRMSVNADPQYPSRVQVATSVSRSASVYSVESDVLLEHGGLDQYSGQYFDPPLRYPIRMQAGDTSNQSTVAQTYSSVGLEATADITSQKTYVGRETIDTKMGKFETCKFETRIRYASRATPAVTRVQTQTAWLAASSPYRGFVLKSEMTSQTDGGAISKSQNEVTKIMSFDIK